MQVNVSNYADLVTMVKTIKGVEDAFYYDDTPNQFILYVFFAGRKLTTTISGLSSKPATFDADFPEAIAMTGAFGFGY